MSSRWLPSQKLSQLLARRRRNHAASKYISRNSLSHVISNQTRSPLKFSSGILGQSQLRSICTSAPATDELDAKFASDIRRVPCDLLNFMESSRDQFLQIQDPEYLWDTNCVTIGKDGLVDPDSRDPLHGIIITEVD